MSEFLNKKLNVIDCPGADDFIGGALTAMNVTDTGVIVIDSQYGVEVGTQNIFRYTEEMQKPVIFAMNQLDGEKADYDAVIEQLREDFGSKVVPIQYPIVSGPNFNAMIDVLLMKMYSWGPDGGTPTISDIPADQKEKALKLHKQLVEAAAENDEALMEKFFDEGKLSEEDMLRGLSTGIYEGSIVPVAPVSSLNGIGVRPLMYELAMYMPSPIGAHLSRHQPQRQIHAHPPRGHERELHRAGVQDHRRPVRRQDVLLQGRIRQDNRGHSRI